MLLGVDYRAGFDELDSQQPGVLLITKCHEGNQIDVGSNSHERKSRIVSMQPAGTATPQEMCSFLPGLSHRS